LARPGGAAATGEQATAVHANPREIANPRVVADAAAHTLGVDPNTLYPQLIDRTKGFVYVARQADPQKAPAQKRRHLAGLGFYPEERRFYPFGPIASQLVGYAGIDNRGLAGI